MRSRGFEFGRIVLAAVVCLAPAAASARMAQTSASGFAESFAAPIERAHGLEAWRAKRALQAQITVEFDGKRVLEGTMLFETGAGRCRMELKTGQVLVWDGRKAWVGPAGAAFPGARFHLLTWPYFLAAPMKLRDPGAILTEAGSMSLHGRPLPAAKLTFGAGVGDTPDDWYIVYRNPETQRLKAMAYIATYGRPRQEAEKEPHLIQYDDHVDVEGVKLPRRWTFWNWSADQGSRGEPIGSVELSNLTFVTPSPDAFLKPEGASEDALPGS